MQLSTLSSAVPTSTMFALWRSTTTMSFNALGSNNRMPIRSSTRLTICINFTASRHAFPKLCCSAAHNLDGSCPKKPLPCSVYNFQAMVISCLQRLTARVAIGWPGGGSVAADTELGKHVGVIPCATAVQYMRSIDEELSGKAKVSSALLVRYSGLAWNNFLLNNATTQ